MGRKENIRIAILVFVISSFSCSAASISYQIYSEYNPAQEGSPGWIDGRELYVDFFNYDNNNYAYIEAVIHSPIMRERLHIKELKITIDSKTIILMRNNGYDIPNMHQYEGGFFGEGWGNAPNGAFILGKIDLSKMFSFIVSSEKRLVSFTQTYSFDDGPDKIETYNYYLISWIKEKK